MADQKITQLTEDTTPSSSDLLKTTKDPAGTPLDRKVTLLNVLKGAVLGLLTSDNDILVRAGGVAARLNVPASRILGREASGDIAALTGAEAGGIIGVYAAYTPTIKGGATTVTTSSLTARYCQIGKMVHAYGKAVVSSAGAAAPAEITVALPVNAKSGLTFFPVGTGAIDDASPGNYYRALVCHIDASNRIRFYRDSATVTGGNPVGVDPSFALASGDEINWNIMYEAA